MHLKVNNESVGRGGLTLLFIRKVKSGQFEQHVVSFNSWYVENMIGQKEKIELPLRLLSKEPTTD
jgi:hypothetical protein